MTIYFAASIRAGREYQERYAAMIDLLSKHGEVLTEKIGTHDLLETGEIDRPQNVIYNEDIGWLSRADVVVAEVTKPSLGVGYEIAYAEKLGKPLLCLFAGEDIRNLSAMISGCPALTVCHYRVLEELPKALTSFFSTLVLHE